jgi:ribosomal protein S18 acetylase RimI-like enzyme
VERAGDHVVLAGWRTDVRDLLALMDVFVLASWREGLPRSAVEAAAMARPLVLTDIRGCREVARNEREGLLVPTRRPEVLAVAILRLLRDTELRKRLGTAARERALGRFDERRVADTVIGTYRSLLARKGVMAAPDEPIQLRPARQEDIPTLARMHREIRDAFLSTLGDRFLRRLYRALVDDRDAVVVVAENGQGIVGFATGVASVPDFYRRFFRRHGAMAALAAAPHLLRPATIRRALETAGYPQSVGSLPNAEFLSMAVAPGVRARGIGTMLAGGIRRGLAERGVSEFKVVVGVPNEAPNRLFARLGYECRTQITVHDGVPSNVWVKQTQESEVS